MRKVLLILLILFIFPGVASAVFTLGVNSGSIAFLGSVDPGTWTQNHTPTDLIATCTTDNGIPWHLSIEYDNELSNGLYTIPYPNFKCWGWRQSGGGTFNIPDGTSISLSTTPFVAYDSSGSETAEIHFQFGVWVPEDTVAGTYTNQIILTMYE